MKKIKLQLLFVLFTFSQLNGMNEERGFFSFSDMRSFMKDNPITILIAAIGIPTFLLLCYKSFKTLYFTSQQKTIEKLLWIKTMDGELYSLTISEAKKYPVLDYYIEQFGKKNSKESPLIISSKEGLVELSRKDINTFLYELQLRYSEKKTLVGDGWRCKLEDALEIGKRLSKDLDIYIAQFLQRLYGGRPFSFVLGHMLNHTVRSANNYQKKHFFNNKEFYWTECLDRKQMLYDKEHNNILTIKSYPMNHGLSFCPAYNGNAVLTRNNNGVTIHNLETESAENIMGNFSNFELSPNGGYVGVRSSGTNTIHIYTTSDITRSIASVRHDNLRDFAFSPDGSKFISYGGNKIVLWDLHNIKNITSRELLSDVECHGIVFNSDNEHICAINGEYNYTYDNNEFTDVNEITIINIKSGNIIGESFKFHDSGTAFVFPDNSDVIMLQETINNGKGIYRSVTALLNKNGDMLSLPDELKNSLCSINGDYLAAKKEDTAYIFDHRMAFVGKINGCAHTIFTLEPRTENALTGFTTHSDGKLKERFYWPLPDQHTMATGKQISNAMTTAQFTLLEKICSQGRLPREILVLNDERDKSIFKTFDELHQPSLKEKLYLELPA